MFCPLPLRASRDGPARSARGISLQRQNGMKQLNYADLLGRTSIITGTLVALPVPATTLSAHSGGWYGRLEAGSVEGSTSAHHPPGGSAGSTPGAGQQSTAHAQYCGCSRAPGPEGLGRRHWPAADRGRGGRHRRAEGS